MVVPARAAAGSGPIQGRTPDSSQTAWGGCRGLGCKKRAPSQHQKGPVRDQGCPRICVPGKWGVHPLEESFRVVLVLLEAFGDAGLARGVVWLQQEQKPFGEMVGFEPTAFPEERSPVGRRWQRCAQGPGTCTLPLPPLCPRLPGDVRRAGNSSRRLRDAWRWARTSLQA